MNKRFCVYGLLTILLGVSSAGLAWDFIIDDYGTMVNMQQGESLPKLFAILENSGHLYSCVCLILTAIASFLIFGLMFKKKSLASRKGLILGGVCGLFVILLIASGFFTILAVFSFFDGALLSFLREWKVVLVYALFVISAVLLWILATKWT